MGASLSITLTQGTQDVVNNRTLVTATVKVTATGATWNGYSRPGTLVLDGASYSFSKGFAKETTTTLYTANKWCYHNSVGAKTVSASASYNTGVSPGTISASASKPLTTIPRATEPTLSTSSVELGSDVTINLPRKASAFTHAVIYSIGAASGTIATGAGTSVKWTPPISLASELPNATSGTVVIKVKTYSGGTLIGTKTINLTITVPAHVKPSVAIQVDDATNNLEMFGYYLVGHSRYKVTATEKTMYGATITKRRTVMNGVTYTSLNPTSGPITSIANDNVVCTVTDSRGRTASVTINGLPTRIYTPPVIVSYLTPSRCTADGLPDEDGDYIKAGFTFIFDDIGGANAATAKIKARPRISETYSYEVIVTSGEEIILPADHNYTYFILFEVTDTLGSKVPYEYRLNTHDAVLSAKLGYKLAIGKAAELGTPEKPVFESAWHTVLTTVETSGNATLDSLNVVKDSTFNGNVAIKGDLTLDVDQAFIDQWSSVFGTGGG